MSHVEFHENYVSCWVGNIMKTSSHNRIVVGTSSHNRMEFIIRTSSHEYYENYVSWVLWELRLVNVIRASSRDIKLWELRLKTEWKMVWELDLPMKRKCDENYVSWSNRRYNENHVSWPRENAMRTTSHNEEKMWWELRLIVE